MSVGLLSRRAASRASVIGQDERVLGTRSLRSFFGDGLLTSASDIVPLQFLAVYALALGATAAQVGLIATAAGLAGVLALPVGVWLADHSKSLKRVVLLGSGGARVVLLLLAGVPLVLGGNAAVYALIGLGGVRWFCTAAFHPAWTAMVTKIVPASLRRLYFSRRALAATVVAVSAAPMAGRLIDGVGGVEGYQVAFLLAALIGAAASVCYARVEEPASERNVEAQRGSYRAMLRHSAFRRYLALTFVLHTSTMVAGPFFAVYLVQSLGASSAQVGGLAAVDGLSSVAGQAVAALLVMRLGPRRMLVGAMALIPLLPLIWWLIDSPWQAVIPNALGGGAWAVFHLAAFNLLLEYAPSGNVPRYAAAHQAAMLAASFVGPLIGTFIVASWGLRATFVVSALGRVLALAVMAWPARSVEAATYAVAADASEGNAGRGFREPQPEAAG